MKKTTLVTLSMRVLLLFPIFTTLSFIPGTNTFLSALSLAIVAVLVFKKGITTKAFFLLVAALVSTALNLFITDGKIININEAIYLGYMCVFFALLIDNKQQIKEYFLEDSRFIQGVCLAWSLLVLISIPLRISWTPGGAFISFSGDSFRLSPSALCIMILSTLLIVTQGKKNIIYSFVPIISILLGVSRTYLLLGCLCFAINFYFVIQKKTRYFLFLFVMAALCIVVVFSSSMGEKILNSFSENDYLSPLAVFTSGRSNFWARDWEAYLEQPFFNQLLGSGFNFVRDVNGAFTGDSAGIWAHNDFLQVVITNGIFGFGIYMYAINWLFRSYMSRKIPRLLRWAVVLVWLFNAFFNMYYVYICAMISLPILLLAVEIGCNERYKMQHSAKMLHKGTNER